MALLAAKTQRVLATGVYSGLAVTALLGAIALGNGVRLALTTPLTAVSSSPQPAVTARIRGGHDGDHGVGAGVSRSIAPPMTR